MHSLKSKIKYMLFPKTDMKTMLEINKQNLSNMYGVSAFVGIMQIVSLIIYVLYALITGEKLDMLTLLTVGASVVMCAISFAASRFFRKNTVFYDHHRRAVNICAGVFFVLLLMWGMFASVRNYERGEQIITFYTVVILVALFVKLRPVFTISLILSSFIVFYIILIVFIRSDQINPYNYFSLAVICAVGALINFGLTVNFIQEKDKADELNRSLNVVASQDSLTGLANRYAMNRMIPTFIGKEVCVAMGDLNRFKQVNDTLGHHAGDMLLKQFADILIDEFPKDSVFRYGGDEFIIAYVCDDFEYFLQKIESVNIEFSRHCELDKGVKSGCSFGCVMGVPKTMAEFFDMIKRADKELYIRKKALNIQR